VVKRVPGIGKRNVRPAGIQIRPEGRFRNLFRSGSEGEVRYAIDKRDEWVRVQVKATTGRGGAMLQVAWFPDAISEVVGKASVRGGDCGRE